MEYSIRIDVPALASVDALQRFLTTYCSEYTVAHETVDGENPHYQGYIKSTNADSTLRRYVQELLTQKGNRAYSLKKLKKSKEELLQYVCKDLDVRWTTLSDEQLKVYKDLGSARKQEVLQAREKKEAKKPMITRLREELNLETVETREDVARLVVRWYAEADIVIPCDRILLNYIDTLYVSVLRKYHPTRYEDYLNYYPSMLLGSFQAGQNLRKSCYW